MSRSIADTPPPVPGPLPGTGAKTPQSACEEPTGDAAAHGRTPAWIVAAVAGGALLLFGIGAWEGSHFDSDDALYAEMAREMVRTGDIVDNQWSGAVLFEKPPLYLWTLAASGALFGWGEAAMRLPGTLFAAMALVSLLLLARGLKASMGQAVAAVGLLAGSYFFVLMTRRLMMDVPLLACALAAATAMVRGRAALFGAFCGAAVLAKGPAAAPLVAAILLFGALDGRRPGLRSTLLAAAACLAVAAPWHIAVTLRHGSDFWEGYLGYHVAARASSSVVPGLTAAELLEVLANERLLLALGLSGLFVALLRRVRASLCRFAVTWLALSLLPPLLSTTRLAHYLLPAAPALALLAAAAPPAEWWARRLAAPAVGAVVLAAFLAHPGKLVFWLDADFGPDERALGEEISAAAGVDDLVAAYDTTTAALTFYGGGRRVEMLTDDPRFHAVQSAVLMIRRAGVLRRLDERGFPDAPARTGRRFVVARTESGLLRLAFRLRTAQPGRPLFVTRAGKLALVNDAGIGDPLDTER